MPESVSLYGVDVSKLQLSQFDYPKNIHFSIKNIIELPEKWTAKFDFVHQRLLIGGHLAKDWPRALSSFLRILKPGGIAQLLEVEIRCRDQCGYAGKRVVKIQEQMFARKGLLFDCAVLLPSLLERAGFVNVRAEKKLAPVGEVLGPDGKRGKHTSAGSIRAMHDTIIASGLVDNHAEFEELVKELEQTWEDMGGFYMTYWIVTAEKPHH